MPDNTPSQDLIARVDEILKQDIVDRHSFYQMKHFILGKEYTTQGKMWQCLKEIRARKNSLENIDLEIESTKDNLELVNIRKVKEKDGMGNVKDLAGADQKTHMMVGESQVKYRQLEREATALKNSIEVLKAKKIMIEEETSFFAEQFEAFNKIEPLKPLDDADAQGEYWNAKLGAEVNLRVLLGAPLDVEIIRTILCLHDTSPLKQSVVKMLNQKQKILETTKETNGQDQQSR